MYVDLVYYTSLLHSTMIFTCVNIKKQTDYQHCILFTPAPAIQPWNTLDQQRFLRTFFSIFGPKPMSYGWLYTSCNVHPGRASWRTRCSRRCTRNRTLPGPERRWDRCRAPQPPAATLRLTSWDCKVGHLITAVSNRAALPAVGWDDGGGMPRCKHYRLSDGWCAPSGSVRTSTLAAATRPRCHELDIAPECREASIPGPHFNGYIQLGQHPLCFFLCRTGYMNECVVS